MFKIRNLIILSRGLSNIDLNSIYNFFDPKESLTFIDKEFDENSQEKPTLQMIIKKGVFLNVNSENKNN